MKLDDVIIVLSRPSESGNIGAVCRAMKNMGLNQLRIVKENYLEAPFDEEQIKTRAVHAYDVWENSVIYSNLDMALNDCTLIIGTTRRRGRKRKRVSMNPKEIAEHIKKSEGKAAIVFGNERTGLDDEEIELCNIASHIPVDESFPSLNLSHAVQIYTYEIFQSLTEEVKNNVKGQWTPLDKRDIEKYVEKIVDNLKLLGFYKQIAQDEQELFFRDLISRASLTDSEAKYLANIISKTAHLGLLKKSIKK